MVGSLTAHRGYKSHYCIATVGSAAVTFSGPALPVNSDVRGGCGDGFSWVVGGDGGVGGGGGSKVLTLRRRNSTARKRPRLFSPFIRLKCWTGLMVTSTGLLPSGRKDSPPVGWCCC